MPGTSAPRGLASRPPPGTADRLLYSAMDLGEEVDVISDVGMSEVGSELSSKGKQWRI